MSSTYEILGIPESVVIIAILFFLSLSLSPWFGGMEIGPVKVPDLRGKFGRSVKIAAPIALVICVLGFFPYWPISTIVPPVSDPAADSVADPVAIFPQTVTFRGRLGGYGSSGEIVILDDCTFAGIVEFTGEPTGGNLNSIKGSMDGTGITFTRRLEGSNVGQTDQFKGTIAEGGRKLLGTWAGFTYEATVIPRIETCGD